jgi:hypothetical protein
MRWKYASVGTEAVFPLTSTLIISKLALFPASMGCAVARDLVRFGSWHAPLAHDEKFLTRADGGAQLE